MSIDSFKSTLVFKNDDALNIGAVSKNKKYLAPVSYTHLTLPTKLEV